MARPRKSDKPSAAEERKRVLDAITKGYEGDDIVSKLFQASVELDREKRDVFTRMAANRRSLRDLAAQGLANKDDVDAVYPPKKDAETDANAAA